MTYGSPETLIPYNETQFCSSQSDKYYRQRNIGHIRTLSYHSRLDAKFLMELPIGRRI
ncbi:unnamed protein product [Hymenolepis diminuta]|uniref:Uncharacterized protein n=1 Tax=Hymenolepis diminuta TaxID=6216 RepID=A0A564Z407_HYMDI|nr:unnamed protein product [Hymenolepis diminuta]